MTSPQTVVTSGGSDGRPADVAGPAGPRRRRGSRFRGRHSRAELILFGGLTVVLLALVAPPVIFLVTASLSRWEGFRTTGWTLDGYRELLGSGVTLELFVNTAIFAAGSSCVALVFGVLFAWLAVRTNVPFKGMIFATMFISFAIPGIVKVIGWILLLGPNAGWLNELAGGLGLDGGLLDVFSLPGMIMVEGLLWTPIIFLLMLVPFSTVDPSLEEAAQTTGATTWQVFRRITLPMALPSVLACLLLSLIRSLEAFEIPALLGLPGGVRVFTSEIYTRMTSGIFPNYGLASAYSIVLIVLVVGLLLAYTRMTSKTSKFNTVTGRGYKPALLDLGRARWPVGFLSLSLTFVLFLPILALAWASLLPFYQSPSVAALGSVSIDNYLVAVGNPTLSRATGNTLFISLTAALATSLVTLAAAWLLVRSRIPGRKSLDFLVMLPVALPSIVAGIAVLRTYINLPIGVYGTIWILVLGFIMRNLPYSMRYNHPGMLQLHAELEESAEVSGAGFLTRIRRIVVPLMLPALAASFLYVFLVSIRELPMSLLLSGAGREVVSVAIFDLYQNGQVTELAAFCVLVAAAVTVLAIGFLALARRYGITVK